MLFDHLEETFNAFVKLWKARNTDHITLLEIEAYVRLFSVPNKEHFVELILAADSAVWDAAQKVKEKKDKFNKDK